MDDREIRITAIVASCDVGEGVIDPNIFREIDYYGDIDCYVGDCVYLSEWLYRFLERSNGD